MTMTTVPYDWKVLKSVVGGEEHGSGLGFGCMGITAYYGDSMPDEEALKLLKAVYDSGIRHYDTAELYVQNDKYNETIIGEFVKTIPRETVCIATKYWPKFKGDADYGYDEVKQALTGSLERLQLDYVDLYYAHRVTSLDGGIRFAHTAKRLLEEGLIKNFGLSEVTGEWLRQIHAICPIAAVQQEWSLVTRSLERELVPVCKELNVTVVAYSPLSKNLLTAKTEAPTDSRDFRSDLPRFSKENLSKNQAIVDQVKTIATKYGCTAAQLSLAWLFHQATSLGVAVVPIAGTTKIANATSNAGSINVIISEDDTHVLEKLADQVAGERYGEQYMALTIEKLQS